MHGRASNYSASLGGVAKSPGRADVETAIGATAVKDQLRANNEKGIASGVFGVPTFRHGDQLFWGNDAMPLFDGVLADPGNFYQGEYQRFVGLQSSVERLKCSFYKPNVSVA